MVAEVDPDRKQFPNLRYAPFVVELGELFHKWGRPASGRLYPGQASDYKDFSGNGVDAKFALLPDDTKLFADGADTTRVVFRVTDELAGSARRQ